jgi:hypothetical protein
MMLLPIHYKHSLLGLFFSSLILVDILDHMPAYKIRLDVNLEYLFMTPR